MKRQREHGKEPLTQQQERFSLPDLWNTDFLDVRLDIAQPGPVFSLTHLGDPITALAFQGATLWAACSNPRGVYVFRDGKSMYSSHKRVLASHGPITDMVYLSQSVGRLLMLDIGSRCVWSWIADKDKPDSPLTPAVDVSQWKLKTPLPAWTRMAAWVPPKKWHYEVFLSGVPIEHVPPSPLGPAVGGLLRRECVEGGLEGVLPIYGRDPLLQELTSGPYCIDIDQAAGVAILAGENNSALFECDLKTGLTTRIVDPPAFSTEGEAPLGRITDVKIYRYKDFEKGKGALTPESKQVLESAIKDGRDRCILLTDAVSGRIFKKVELGRRKLQLTLAGGGDQEIPVGQRMVRPDGVSTMNLQGYRMPACTRLAVSSFGLLAVTFNNGRSVAVMRSRFGGSASPMMRSKKTGSDLDSE